MRPSFWSFIAAGLLLSAAPSAAQAQADFYRGKTVTIVVGARVTGSLSITAQIVARHGSFPKGTDPLEYRRDSA